MRAEQWVGDFPWIAWDGWVGHTRGLIENHRAGMLDALCEGAWAWFDEAERSEEMEAAWVELFGGRP